MAITSRDSICLVIDGLDSDSFALNSGAGEVFEFSFGIVYNIQGGSNA
jgi:hypothetical protein